MIIPKSMRYFQEKVRIDKANHRKTAQKIQFYNDKLIDNLVENHEIAGEASKPPKSMIMAELSILNKPEIYKYYNRIIQSPYVNKDAIHKMIIKNKANKNLERVVLAELKSISKNLDYCNEVLNNYEVPIKDYKKLVKKQEKESVANRKQILEKVAIKANDLLVSEGLNIPTHVFQYKQLETTAQALLRESQMTAKFEEVTTINESAVEEGKDPIFTHKSWVNTGRKNTRHMHNHGQTVEIDEPFLVMHDKTLQIDEMMYPCDPAGSWANAWICYCDVDYTDKEGNIFRDALGLNQTSFKINSQSISTPTTTVSEPVPSVTFKQSLDIPLSSPKPKEEYVDIVKMINDGKAVYNTNGDYLLENDINYFFDKASGKYYYNGLEIKPHKSSVNPDKIYYFKVSEEDLAKFNNKFIDDAPKFKPNKELEDYIDNNPVGESTVDEILTEKPNVNFDEIVEKEYIHLDELNYDVSHDDYIVDKYNGVKYDKTTGKYHYNGLELKNYDPVYDIGTITKEEINAHNQLYDSTKGKQFEEKIIKPSELSGVHSNGEYSVDEILDGLVYDSKAKTWKLNGLEVDYDVANEFGIITEKEIDLHNAYVTSGKKAIDTDVLVYSEKTNKYLVGSNDLKYNPVLEQYEYNGLKVEYVDGGSPSNSFGRISRELVDEYNQKYFDKEPNSHHKFQPKEEPIPNDLILSEMDANQLGDIYYDIKIVAPQSSVIKVGDEYWYKGLKLDNYHEGHHHALVEKEKLIKHNVKLGEWTEKPPSNAQYIDITELTTLDTTSSSYYINGDDPNIKKYITHNAEEGYWEYKGLKIEAYTENSPHGYIDYKDIENHNKKLNKESKIDLEKEWINTDILEELDYENWWIEPQYQPELEKDIKFNNETQKWEYKGIEIENSSPNNKNGWISKEKVYQHNLEVENTVGGFINESELYIDPIDDDFYLVHKTNLYKKPNGKYSYKGLEVEYDPIDDYASIEKEAVKEHNFKLEQLNGAFEDKGDFLGSSKLQYIKKKGEHYVVDKTTGKEYVYDIDAKYEQAQDNKQFRVNYSQDELHAGESWGGYDHHNISGLIHRQVRVNEVTGEIKQNYKFYEKYMDKLTPLYDKHLDLALKLNDGEITESYYLSEKEKILSKMDRIISNIDHDYSVSKLDGLDIEKAMWDILDLDGAIAKSPLLLQDTALVRFGHWFDEWCEVGKIVSFDGFSSTTYKSESADHFAGKPGRWAIRVLAEEGTRGIRLNSQFNAYEFEREWLLGRYQKFEVMEYDKTSKTCTIKLIK